MKKWRIDYWVSNIATHCFIEAETKEEAREKFERTSRARISDIREVVCGKQV